MTINVHLLDKYAPEIVDYLSSLLDPSLHLTQGEKLDPAVSYHILIGGRPARQLLDEHGTVRSLIIPWTGIPPDTRTLLSDFPHITVHNIHHNSVAVAELTIALLLAAAKNVIAFDSALRQGDWRMRYQTPAPSLALNGKTALILGYGAIGRHVARICRVLGMQVFAIRRRPELVEENNQAAHKIASADHLHELLPRANVLIIALPLTPVTEGLIDAYELALLPPGSILINVGRGRIVAEKALYEALEKGDLGAAGLDVWYNYPGDEVSRSHTFPAEYPFWELGNVVLSPHRAGLTADIDLLRMDHLARLLNAAAKNLRIPNEIDLHAGY